MNFSSPAWLVNCSFLWKDSRMEQDEALYEYKMGSEIYRFEAHSHGEAEKMRTYAIQFFSEKLGTLFSPDALSGPELAPLPASFRLEKNT